MGEQSPNPGDRCQFVLMSAIYGALMQTAMFESAFVMLDGFGASLTVCLASRRRTNELFFGGWSRGRFALHSNCSWQKSILTLWQRSHLHPYQRDLPLTR